MMIIQRRKTTAPSVGWRTSVLVVIAAAATALLTSAPVAVAAESGSGKLCDLDCKHDTPCVEGDASFKRLHDDDNRAHATNYDGSELDFHETKSIDGKHCSCPHGWTGVLCDTPYQGCDGNHVCYNGGSCIPGLIDQYGNEQLYCDCSNAIDDDTNTKYVGKYCEQAGPSSDDGDESYCDDDQTQFCLNGAECNKEYPNFGDPCLCPPGYEGPNCQYVSGTVPDCTLECQNNGVCTYDLSPTHKKEQEQFLFQYWEQGDNLNDPNPQHARCDCPDNYDGELCEIPRVECGENYCYHGGTCLERVVDDKTVYHCDCTSSYSASASYAGRFCQYEATSYCTKDGGLNGHLFCVNDGQCNKDDPYEGCLCPEPFSGFSCEFITDELSDNDDNQAGSNHQQVEVGYEQDSNDGTTGNQQVDVEVGYEQGNQEVSNGQQTEIEVGYDQDNEDDYDDDEDNWVSTKIYDPPEATACDLNCRNDGVCRVGLKQTGFLQDLAHTAPHLNQTDENFMHCVCPDGYYGVYCEEEVDICGNKEHYCLHGSICIPSDGEDGGEHKCDCVQTNSEVASIFAGESCEHPVNDICSEDVSLDTTPLSFCVNRGTCKRKVGPGESHPGCDCEENFTGPHCELREGASPRYNSDGPPAFQIIVLAMSVIAISVVAIFSITAYVRRRRAKNSDQITESLRWSSNYRDDPDDGPNLAPRRSSVLDDDALYAANFHSSSTDPMATHLAPGGATTQPSNAPTMADLPDGNTSCPAGHSTTTAVSSEEQQQPEEGEPKPPQIYIGPPRDEDGHELHSVEII